MLTETWGLERFGRPVSSKCDILLYYPKYLERQTWSNSGDPDQNLERCVWSGSTLFSTRLAVFKRINNKFENLGQIW